MENSHEEEISRPIVTVFMAAYNSSLYIGTSIQSILDQSFEDFELLIINDGSTDETLSVIEQFDDPRIRVLSNETNKGLTFTRNRGWQEAKGKYLAILDSDDIALQNRLHLQHTFLEAHPNVAICGGQAIIIDKNGEEIGVYTVPTNNEYLKEQMLFRNVFVNPSCMIKIDVIKKLGGYLDYAPAEDFNLSLRILGAFNGANLDIALIKYRDHQANASIRTGKVAEQELRIIKGLHQQLEMPVSEKLVNTHHAIFLSQTDQLPMLDIKNFFVCLIIANKNRNIYNHIYLEGMIFERWLILLRSKRKYRNSLPMYFNKTLFKWRFFKWSDFRKMLKSSVRGVFYKMR